jgi:oligosaccharyltransferase complex subunit alpha (ribophorin I)
VLMISSYVLYPIILSKALDPQSTLNITVSLIFTHTMRPYPAQIKQMEPQLVVYQDNVFFLSPYSSITQTTTVKLPSIRVESYTQAPPKVEKKGGGDTIVYGPYHDIEAFSSAELSVHFENSKPFLTITKLIREFEISHWGNLAVEERFWVEHGGAKHTGQFCRTDYQVKLVYLSFSLSLLFTPSSPIVCHSYVSHFPFSALLSCSRM